MPRRNLRHAQRGLLIICVNGGAWICESYRVVMNLSIRGSVRIDPGQRDEVGFARGIMWKERRCLQEAQHGHGLSGGVLALVLNVSFISPRKRSKQLPFPTVIAITGLLSS